MSPTTRRSAPLLALLAVTSSVAACNAVFGIIPGELGGTTGAGGTTSSSASAGTTGAGGATSASTTGTGGTMTGAGGGDPLCKGLGGADQKTFVRSHRAGGSWRESSRGVALVPDGSVVLAGEYEDSDTIFGLSPLPYPADPPDAGLGEGRDVFLAGYTASGLFDWAVGFTGPGHQWVTGLARENNGQLLLAGNMFGSITFGATTLTSDDSRGFDTMDVYLARFQSDGVPLWAKRFGGPDEDAVKAVIVDSTGAAIIAGVTYGGVKANGADVDFCGEGAAQLVPQDQDRIFLSKFDAGGSCLWTHLFPVYTGFLNYWNPGFPIALAVDPFDNVVMTGGFDDAAASFGQGTLTNRGAGDAFLYKCDSNGNYLFATSFGSDQQQYGSAVATDACGNIYVGGSFVGPLPLDPLPPLAPPQNSGLDPLGRHLFLARFDVDPNPESLNLPTLAWRKGYWDDGAQEASKVLLDGAGNPLLIGNLSDVATSKGVDFGDGMVLPGKKGAGPGPYDGDFFVAKLKGNGDTRWAKRFSTTGAENAWAAAVNEAGHLVVTGDFDTALSFGGPTEVPSAQDLYYFELGP